MILVNSVCNSLESFILTIIKLLDTPEEGVIIYARTKLVIAIF